MKPKIYQQPTNILSKLPQGYINGLMAYRVDFTRPIDQLVIKELMKEDD